MNTREVGRFGETCATRYLKKKGYKILFRNWTAFGAEIDIIALDGLLVFVEVKFVTNCSFCYPTELYTKYKSLKLINSIKAFFAKNRGYRSFYNNWRLDLITLTGFGDFSRKKIRLVHYQDLLGS